MGGGWNNTTLQWSDTASTVGKNGARLGTYLSASVAVEANYFIARNITFKVNPIPLSTHDEAPPPQITITSAHEHPTQYEILAALMLPYPISDS